MRRALVSVLAILLVAAFLAAGCSGSQKASKYPSKPVELVPAGDPGGGLDILARMIEQAMRQENMLDQPFTIVNKGGGGGNVCTAYMVTQKGSGYHLAINSNRVLLNPLLGTTEYDLDDMTPVARLTTEYEAWIVKSDSKYKSALEVLEDLKKNPEAVTFGVGTIPSNDQFNVLIPAKARGIDITKLKIVAFRSGGDLMTQLLGGHVPVASTSMSEALEQVRAGQARILVVSSPTKLDVLPDVPCWRDLGIDCVIYHWRGVFGPPDMPKDAYDYWVKKLAELVKKPAWKELLQRYNMYDAFLPGDQFKAELEKDMATYKELLGALGMLKK